MTFKLADRVKETTTTAGTSNVVLGGAYDGYRTFATAIGNAHKTYYVIVDQSNNNWEVGVGTYHSAGNILSRDTVLESSNSNDKISLTGGVSDVFVSYPAEKVVCLNPDAYISGVAFSGYAFPDGSTQTSAAVEISDASNLPNSIAIWSDASALTKDAGFQFITDKFVNNHPTEMNVLSGIPLTITRYTSGNFFEAYIDNTNDRTLSLYLSDESSPTWKLGLKNDPSNNLPPEYGYTYGSNGSVGQNATSDTYTTINYSNGMWFTHKSSNLFNFDKTNGGIVYNATASAPAFTIKGAAAQSANLQEWKNISDTVVAYLEPDGSISGNALRVSGIIFPDGTTQSTTAADGAFSVASGVIQLGLINTNISNIATNTNNIVASGTTIIDSSTALTIASGTAIRSEVASNTSSIGGNTGSITVNRDNIVASGTSIINSYTDLVIASGTAERADTVASGTSIIGQFSSKANLNSPAFAGTPTAPTAAALTNTTQIATTAFVRTEVTNLVDSAPGALDTLNELAAAINDDASFSTTVTNSIATKASLATLAGASGALQKDIDLVYASGDAVSGIAFGAYAWGNHASVGYGTPTDLGLLYASGSDTSGIAFAAYARGDHRELGLVTHATFGSQGLIKRGSTSGTYTFITDNSSNWNTAYGWGDHGSEGYLTAETFALNSGTAERSATIQSGQAILDLGIVRHNDFDAHGFMKRGATSGVYTIVTDNSANWNTAYGWGDHGSAGYLTAATFINGSGTSERAATIASGTKLRKDIDLVFASGSDTSGIAFGAYAWGNHGSAGYLTTATFINGSGTAERADTIASGTAIRSEIKTYTATSGLELHGATAFAVGISGDNLLATNDPVDNYVPSFDLSSRQFTWVENTGGGGGSMSSFIVTDGSTPQTVNDGETVTFADGTGAEFVTSATNTVTVNSVDSEIVHDNLSGFVANEHIDWTLTGAGTIHATNYTDTNTQLTEDQVDDYVAGLLTAGSNISLTYDDAAGTLTIDSSYTDTNTTYTGGTNLTLAGTTFNVDDAFLKNDASDVTTGTITAAGFTTAGTLTVDSIGISTIQSSAESFVDNDTSLMTSAAIADKIEAYGYGTSGGDITGVDLTAGAGITIDSETNTTSGDYSATITCTVTDTNTQLSQEQVEDFVNGVLTAGSNVSLTYDDAAGTLTVASTDTVYTLPEATATAKGGIELFSDTDQSVAATAVSTTAARTYGLQLNSDGQGVINVPWTDTDTNTTYSAATSSALGLMKLEDDTEQSVAANAVTATASRTYGIQFNSSDQAVVNVPWVDTNTTYTVGDGGLTQINFTSADNTKLDGIEASATADQSNAEIKTAVEAGTDIALGGNPTTTTQAAGNNSTRIATTAFVVTEVAALVDSAPGTLDTLNELAAALGDDASFSTTVTNSIATKMPLAGGAFSGAVTTNSTFDGRDVATDGTKLDGIEASADVTDATNVTAAGALMDSEVTNLSQVKAFDSSDYATAAQGTKADSAQQPPTEGAFANGDKTKLDAIEASADVTDATNVTAAGALMDSEVTNLAAVKAFATSDYATAAQGSTADAALPKAGGAMVGAITTNSTFDGRDVATDGTKLDGIEASADVTDTANVTAAGALMDSELTDLAGVKGVTISTLQVKPTEGAFANGDKTKLDGIEASADVTDTANVTSAGALMDSELASIADVKALDQSVISGSSPNFTTANMSDASNKRFMTDAQESKLDGIEASATADQSASEIKTLLENGIDSVHYVDGSIDLIHMSAESVDSDQYVDLSIDTAHIGNLQVTTGKIAADAITGAKIADDAIDSEHYAAGSIDTAHIADDQVTYAKMQHTGTANRVLGAASAGAIGEVQVATAMIADDAVTLAKMAGLARGKIIVGDNSGNPSALAAGTEDYVLTMDSNGDAVWAAAGGGAVSAVANGADNRVTTFSSSTALNGEANLTFDGSTLGLTGCYVQEAVPANDTPTAEDATITLDLNSGNYHNISLGADVTKVEFTNANRGQRFILRITQHASSAKTVAWTNVDSAGDGTPATVRWAGGTVPVMSTSTSHTDVYGFLCTNNAGTAFDGFIIGQDLPD